MPVTGQRVVRRTLGRRLTLLRAASGKSRREVAEERLGISEPTLHRIETGKVPVTVANVRALCWLYGADESVTGALAELALGTSQEEWWDASPAIPDWFKLYVGLEASASQICSYDGEVVPGELQTEQYARAVFAAEQSTTSETADRQVKLRIQRQKTLFSRSPELRLVTVLGEGALTRPVGGEAVLKAQIEHLRQLARRDDIEIKVLPWSVGAHAAMAGAFRILDFDDPDDPDVVYLESHVGALYLEEPAEVNEYRRIFELIRKDAIPVEEYR
ncbi:helix-turn-helix domain-containing protein [Planosporangium mesophilum]|uniref:Transcriptional regulator n=1 Tax=Planosporangium mesophilum TaxID=689768 RepID=A0A8J3TEG1_9ACTN|nr:helix-turn-helix transcriptional regulator [Planosporangium mesophilum]GII24804.1 transcriptional regulator [Planosporangium mesophilum]